MQLYPKSIIVTIFWALLSSVTALAQDTPYTDGIAHSGIMSCDGSHCHSRQDATGTVVRQNEVLSWQDQTSTSGAHFRAYKTLMSERSTAITQRLGLGLPHKEPSCLACHADNIPSRLQGPKFQMADGITCEACHGGSVDWLTQHHKVGASHSKNVSLGLYPLEDAKVRSDVCLSCHLGSANSHQFVSHRMMAAGHPRLSFELDLFTALQSHHDEDVDYYERKTVQPGVHSWAIGQATALKRQLSLFQNPNRNKDGMFPELVFFDCLACHREISDDPNWQPKTKSNPGRPHLPGIVKFNDANMIMLLAIAQQISPEIAPKLNNEIKAFHATIVGEAQKTKDVSAKLLELSEALMVAIDKTDFTKDQTLSILDTIVEDALTRRYTDYVAAEQAIMAIDTLLSSMIATNQVSIGQVANMRDEINKGYAAVENPNTYNQAQLTTALTALQIRLKGLRG